jgi:EmrB/QacA subfamily drug resistance transporter
MSAVAPEPVRSTAGRELALRSPRGRIALAATVAASAMASLDATIVNVAIPHIGQSLHTGVSSLQWVLTGYLLALASLILLAGALGDRFGRRRVFEIGVVWFAAASLLCGVAPSIGWLIAARILQGVGGALLTPGSLAILESSFRPEDRAAAVGAWSGLGGAAGAVGPLVGGAIVDGPGWRWAFLLNLPVAAVVLVCSRSAVPETRGRAGGRLDLLGALIAVATLAAGTWALTEAGPRGWRDAAVLTAAAAGAIGLAMFVVHLLRSDSPLVSPSLFASRVFTVLNVGTLFLYASIGLSFFLVAYQLQTVAGWSALRAGLALLPATLLMLVFSARSGALAERIGPRWQLTVGPLCAAGGLLLLTRVGLHPSWAGDVLPGALLFGVGLVALVAPLTASVMAAADPEWVSTASSVNNAVARVAGLAGLAVVPAASGLATAHGGIDVTHAYRVALLIAAAVAAVAGPVFYFACGHERLRRVRGQQNPAEPLLDSTGS